MIFDPVEKRQRFEIGRLRLERERPGSRDDPEAAGGGGG
jgi:hypothetical protein